jgi:hypothetical protein
MTLLAAPNVHADAAENGGEPISLYRLGMLFLVKCHYWSCRAGSDLDELNLTPDRIDAKATGCWRSSVCWSVSTGR